jgi:hypothetical protein
MLNDIYIIYVSLSLFWYVTTSYLSISIYLASVLEQFKIATEALGTCKTGGEGGHAVTTDATTRDHVMASNAAAHDTRNDVGSHEKVHALEKQLIASKLLARQNKKEKEHLLSEMDKLRTLLAQAAPATHTSTLLSQLTPHE